MIEYWDLSFKERKRIIDENLLSFFSTNLNITMI